MRSEPCQIGSIRPRRQALERRTLHPTRPTVPSGKQWFQNSNNWLSRFVNLHTRRWRGQMQKDDKPHWLHKSATPSPRATYTPDFQIHKPNSPRRSHNNLKLPSGKPSFQSSKKLILCPPFHTHSSSCPFYRPFSLSNFLGFIRQALSEGFRHLGNQTFLWRRVWTLWKSIIFVALWVRGAGKWCETM